MIKFIEEIKRANTSEMPVGSYEAVRYSDKDGVVAFTEVCNYYINDFVYKGIDNNNKICFYKKENNQVWYIVRSKTTANTFSLINDNHKSFTYNQEKTSEFAKLVKENQDKTQNININSKFFNVIKDQTIKTQISKLPTAIKSISLKDGQILIEKTINEIKFIESLNIEIPNFLKDRLYEAISLYVSDGTTSLNGFMTDEINNALNLAGVEIVKLVNDNGNVQFIDSQNNVQDINELLNKVKAENTRNEMVPKVNKKDIELLIKNLLNVINNNNSLSKSVRKQFGKNATIKFEFTGEIEGLQESRIKQYKYLTEGIINTVAKGINKAVNYVKKDLSSAKDTLTNLDNNSVSSQSAKFGLKATLYNAENSSKEKNETFFKELVVKICKAYSGKTFTGSDNNKIKFSLNSNKVEADENECSIILVTSLAKLSTENANNSNDNNDNNSNNETENGNANNNTNNSNVNNNTNNVNNTNNRNTSTVKTKTNETDDKDSKDKMNILPDAHTKNDLTSW